MRKKTMRKKEDMNLDGRSIVKPSGSIVWRAKVKKLGKEDLDALATLVCKLKESGVLERDVEDKDPQSFEDIDEILIEAKKLAKSEKELNPDHYDPEAEAALGEGDLSEKEDWSNPSLDGVDDYGRQIYEDSR